LHIFSLYYYVCLLIDDNLVKSRMSIGLIAIKVLVDQFGDFLSFEFPSGSFDIY